MEKKLTVEEGNKLIAEFMGAYYVAEMGYRVDVMQMPVNEARPFPDFMWNCQINKLKYHASWDWLMPVVEKINTLAIDNYGEAGVYISPGKCHIGENEHDAIKSLESYQSSLIALVWGTVVHFIQWLNQNREQ